MMGGEDGHQEQKIDPIEFMIGRTFWWKNGSELGGRVRVRWLEEEDGKQNEKIMQVRAMIEINGWK